MKVLKFGGTSVGKPEVILEVKKIVESQPIGTIIVVSAFGGITDQLLKTGELARNKDEKYKEEFLVIKERHIDTVNKVITSSMQRDSVLKNVKQTLNELYDLLNGIFYLRDITPKVKDYLVSFGERLSAYIMSEVIDRAYFSDARKFIRTDSNFCNAQVDFEKTNKHIRVHFEEQNHYVIVPGFIASNDDNDTTTLGRGGSDYSAAIIAAALGASVLEIWTDVDGFMTADPRMVEKAYPINTLSYAEAMELSHFGAKVIYTPTIKPVYQKNIPVVIKNTFKPSAKGTIIAGGKSCHSDHKIKGVSSISDITLINVHGAGLVGVKGTSSRLFGALAKNNVNVILITQASSEYSISIAIAPKDAELAMHAINDEFDREINVQQIIRFSLVKDLSIIAIVGEEMNNTPGIAATLFSALGRNGINIVAIAQGSSELNISVVVNKKSLRRALNVIHDGFFLSGYIDIHLFIAGIGNVGSSLIRQIASQQATLLNKHKLNIKITGVARSSSMLMNEAGLALDNVKEDIESKGEKTDITLFIKKMKELNLRNSVFVDCTANKEIADTYKELIQSYISVVTANKIACSSNYILYQELVKMARERSVKFLYETNVGAGLPILKTIDELINSGDSILKIQAVLSGTLNFIFNTMDDTISFSKAVLLAKEKGFAEPDPRIDLSGVDVARKILILARQAGYKMEMQDVTIKRFLPDSCFNGSMDDFWKEIEKLDTDFETKRKNLHQQSRKWRFVASLDNGKAEVQLVDVDSSHPAYHLEGSNNIILITTERYKDQPMIIKGYGAGADVTAAGVFSDIIRIANI